MEKVEVRVSATTANLGPGFDSVGLALSLYNRFTFERLERGLVIEGCEDRYKTEENLTYVAYKRVLKKLGITDFGVKITMQTEIPVSRGLGSSAALIAAGAAAANALYGSPLTDAEVITVCTEIEGHPDNLAPAILGGLVASAESEEGIVSVKYGIDEKFRFVLLVPDFKLSTEKAREALPEKVTIEDAVANISKTAVMLKALETGNREALRAAAHDRLHQKYRYGFISGWDKAKSAARENGADAFFISGAGPTLLCISTEKDFSSKMKKSLKEEGLDGWLVLDLAPETDGIQIKEII